MAVMHEKYSINSHVSDNTSRQTLTGDRIKGVTKEGWTTSEWSDSEVCILSCEQHEKLVCVSTSYKKGELLPVCPRCLETALDAADPIIRKHLLKLKEQMWKAAGKLHIFRDEILPDLPDLPEAFFNGQM